MATILKMPPTDDPALLLNAIYNIVKLKFSKEALANATTSSTQDAASLLANQEALPLGFDTGDAKVNQAALILRLLYINDLRDLQTRINELITTMQEFTAHPTTDVRLGHVGR
eukprot:TRINITY_DN6905_c0_g2_i1.p1 TRINITY_DN6905_c0_g2~~TRINITY_DN6905_c0_g2_i1.p1  ORF type:complete len:132 (+),score=22.27 TRINITY_DN6905_c0_g2_i1:59-397(+)